MGLQNSRLNSDYSNHLKERKEKSIMTKTAISNTWKYARRRQAVTAWSLWVIVDEQAKTELTNMKAPYNFRKFKGVGVVSDKVKVHRVRYKRKMQCIQ